MRRCLYCGRWFQPERNTRGKFCDREHYVLWYRHGPALPYEPRGRSEYHRNGLRQREAHVKAWQTRKRRFEEPTQEREG